MGVEAIYLNLFAVLYDLSFVVSVIFGVVFLFLVTFEKIFFFYVNGLLAHVTISTLEVCCFPFGLPIF